jgi:serine/threonine protein phosphatase PrpC
LAVSRALGDDTLNLCRKIDVFKYKKKNLDEVCVMSDGITDILGN